MLKLADYLTGFSLNDDLLHLSDPALDFEKDRELVNRLVLNITVKYLAVYLEVPTALAPDRLKSEIALQIEFATMVARSQFEEEGVVGVGDQGADNYALRCLADLRQTAAIFKEVVFASRFEKTKDFFGVDLGSGTGVLSLALWVAAKRRGARKIRIVGVERSQLAVGRSRKAIQKLGLEKEIEFVCDDLLRPGLIKKIVQEKKISVWVSETISIAVPAFSVQGSKIVGADHEGEGRKRELQSDPFIEVLRETLGVVPEFAENVKSGKTVLFPDVVNGLYVPDGPRSTLLLKTGLGEPLVLEKMGREFEAYEDLGLKHRRWGKEGDYR